MCSNLRLCRFILTLDSDPCSFPWFFSVCRPCAPHMSCDLGGPDRGLHVETNLKLGQTPAPLAAAGFKLAWSPDWAGLNIPLSSFGSHRSEIGPQIPVWSPDFSWVPQMSVGFHRCQLVPQMSVGSSEDPFPRPPDPVFPLVPWVEGPLFQVLATPCQSQPNPALPETYDITLGT